MALECGVCGCCSDAANSLYDMKMRAGRHRMRTVVCDHCRAAIIDAQASTLTMKTCDPDPRAVVSCDFTRLDHAGERTRDRSSIELTERAVRALPVRVARPLGLKA